MRRDRVVFCGDMNNVGDLLLVLQNLHVDGPGTTVRRWGPLPADIEEQVRAAGGVVRPGRKIVRFAYSCFGRDIVIGGGQLVRDNTALPSLAGMFLAALAARIGGGRVITRGLGVSKIQSGSRKILWNLVLRMADRVNVRDQKSEKNVSSLTAPRRVFRTADMAFLRTDSKRTLFPEEKTEVVREEIVIAPCIDGSEGRTLMGPAIDALIFAAQADKLGKVISIACHDPRPGMDADAATLLIERYPTLPLAMADSHTLSDIAALYARAGLVLTNRLHAMIMAAYAGAPVIALDHADGKLSMYASALNIAVIAPDTPMDTNEAQLALSSALHFDIAARKAAILRLEHEAALNLLNEPTA